MTSATHDEVRDAHHQLCEALVEARVDVLEDLLDEGCTAIHITGYVSPRSEWLDQITSGEFTCHSITDDTIDVDVHADRATTTSTALYDVTLNGHPGRYRLRSVLDRVRHEGRWRAVRGAATTA